MLPMIAFRVQDAKDDDLIFNTKIRQRCCQIAGVPVTNQIAKARIIARVHSRSQLVGRTGHISDDVKHFIPLGT